MNDEQYYVFDSIGLVVARDAVPSRDVELATKIIDKSINGRRVSKYSVLELDGLFMSLMTHPWILSACRRTLEDGFRLDHAFGVQQPFAKPNLHGGPQACQSSCFYNGTASPSGKAWTGRVSVGIALTKQSRETGGFAYIPGSHKSSFLLHGSVVLRDYLGGNFAHESICIPTLNPGDIVFFPDCLVHGTAPWNASYCRRALYYMYSPGYMAWRPYSEIEKYLPLASNATQRNLLRPPYVAGFAEETHVLGDNEWRTPTL